jgi:hypothetical protein
MQSDGLPKQPPRVPLASCAIPAIVRDPLAACAIPAIVRDPAGSARSRRLDQIPAPQRESDWRWRS